MDISSVNPEALVKATVAQRTVQTHLEAQASLLKDVHATQANAIMTLLAAVPDASAANLPQPDGSLGHNVNLYV